jgi:hypothetical protein
VNYKIAIPSYRRPEILKKQTLAVLDRLSVNRDNIVIFVANDEEEETYRNAIGDNYKIVVGHRGISTQRKFYHNWFPDKTRIVSIDDDMSELLELGDGKLIPTQYSIDEIAEMGFYYAEKEGSHLWGINPTMNHFFLKNEISVGLRYICANFMGSYGGDWIFTDPARRMTPTGEDHHSTLRGFTRYGCVVRLEFLCPKTKYFATGGIDACVTEDGKTRAERHAEELRWVQQRYPDISSIEIKANDVVNLRLKPLTFARHTREKAHENLHTHTS